MNVILTIGEHMLAAELFDTATARDFQQLLPITLNASDLMQREKYAHLPRALSLDTASSRSFSVGDIAYWPPGEDIAFFYRDDGRTIPAPGIIKIGRIDAGIEVFAAAGSMTVTIAPGP